MEHHFGNKLIEFHTLTAVLQGLPFKRECGSTFRTIQTNIEQKSIFIIEQNSIGTGIKCLALYYVSTFM